jgi:hypothetical protein
LPQGLRVHVVALMKTDERPNPASYLPKSLTTARPYDTLWFTPSRGQDTTCERLRKKGLIGG